MIILDAFTSDAIPIHLITREAVQLYLKKLHNKGLIVFHISNRFLELGPVVDNIASSLGLMTRRWSDDDDDDASGKTASDWVIVARSKDGFKVIENDKRWRFMPPSLDQDVWTDDYSDLFGALIR